MKIRNIVVAFTLAAMSSLVAQTAPAGSAPAKTSATTQNTTASTGNLDSVLTLLDKTAASFKNIQTDFVWDQYNKVVDDHDLQSGTMYFRRNGNSVEMFA